MLGNCSHCHNPRGLPSVKEPLLADKLNFFPSEIGGIFQFPLDRMSPVRFRGADQDISLPYITPSLYDLPRDDAPPKSFCPQEETGLPTLKCATGAPAWILAPWRSLVYRNVETPFDYFEDFVPFPHMPMHSPGYDCRAPKIIGDWMVSIPAALIHPDKPDYAYKGANANTDNQPYREITPDNPDYPSAVATARNRLDQYHASSRYNFCPPSYTDDIVDRVVTAQVDRHAPVTADEGFFPNPDPKAANRVLMPDLPVPIRPNFIPYDDTDVPGPWFPRNPLWDPGIVDPTATTMVATQTVSASSGGMADPDVIAALTGVL